MYSCLTGDFMTEYSMNSSYSPIVDMNFLKGGT